MNLYSLDLESGSSQYAACNDSVSTSITGNLTLESWVKFESLTGSTMTIAGKYHTASNQQSYIFFHDGVSNLSFGNSATGSGAGFASVSWTPALATWYHLAVAYAAAGGLADFYVMGNHQGAQQSGLATSIYDGTEKLAIGASGPNGGAGGFFDGPICQTRLWAATRSQSEIQANFRKDLTGSETNLNGYWKLNNALTDETANANTLTSSGSPVFIQDAPDWGTGLISFEI